METSKPKTNFPDWKQRFREDCYLHDRRVAFDVMGDEVLRLLWESGLEPTVKAVADGEHEEKPN